MRRLLLALALSVILPAPLSATWSIIAIDRVTGRIVIASSTCAANQPDQLKLLQAIVIPGVGIAAAQAGVDGTHANQKLIFEQMRLGTDPEVIMRMLEADTAIERRQADEDRPERDARPRDARDGEGELPGRGQPLHVHVGRRRGDLRASLHEPHDLGRLHPGRGPRGRARQVRGEPSPGAGLGPG
jgi:hypothetical protein